MPASLPSLMTGRREAAFPVLQRQAQAVDQEGRAFELVMRHLDGGDRPGRGHQRVVAFELEHVDAVADDGVQRQFQRLEAGEEVVGRGLEQGEIGLVVDAEHFGVGPLRRSRRVPVRRSCGWRPIAP